MVLAVALSALPATGAASGTGAEGPEFATSAIVDQRGDVVRIPVRMQRGGNARIEINGRNTGYSAVVTVRDSNRDGRVPFEFNSFRAGSDGAFRAVDDGDEVSVHAQSDVDGLVPAGMYRLLTDDGESYADMELEPRSTDRIRPVVAPDGAFDRLRTSDAVDRFRKAGNLTGREGAGRATVAHHDTLVLRIDATGLSGPLSAQPGTNDSERFRSLVGSDVLSLDVVETNPAPDQKPARLLLNRSGVRFVVDDRRDRYYVVVDTSTVRYVRDGEVRTGLQPGDEFAANVTVSADSKLGADAPRSAAAEFVVVERSVTIRMPSEAGQSFLAPDRDQPVPGTTTVAPGSSIEVRLGSTTSDDLTKSVTVTRTDGTRAFEASVDLSHISEGAVLTATASDHRGSLTDGPVRVTVRSPGASLNEPSLEASGSRLYATVTANLSRGGVVTVRANNDSGRLLGAAAVEPGRRTVRIPLENLPAKNTPMIVTALRDVDGDGGVSPSVDVPYEQSDSPRPVHLTVTLFKLPPSPTPPSPTGATGTTTPSGTTPSDDAPGPGTTGSPPGSPATDDGQLPVDVPGLGTGAALVALGVVLLLFGRRR